MDLATFLFEQCNYAILVQIQFRGISNVRIWNSSFPRFGYVQMGMQSCVALGKVSTYGWGSHPRFPSSLFSRLFQTSHFGLILDVQAGVQNKDHCAACGTADFQTFHLMELSVVLTYIRKAGSAVAERMSSSPFHWWASIRFMVHTSAWLVVKIEVARAFERLQFFDVWAILCHVDSV